MIQSMTGYGKAEVLLSAGKLVIEIRSLNGKSADIAIKSQLLPKEKDLLVRKMISEKLVRGTIDVYLSLEESEGSGVHTVNKEAFHAYWQSIIVGAIILLAVSFDMIKLHREERLQTKVDIEPKEAMAR